MQYNACVSLADQPMDTSEWAEWLDDESDHHATLQCPVCMQDIVDVAAAVDIGQGSFVEHLKQCHRIDIYALWQSQAFDIYAGIKLVNYIIACVCVSCLCRCVQYCSNINIGTLVLACWLVNQGFETFLSPVRGAVPIRT
jgi:hypothetical protein